MSEELFYCLEMKTQYQSLILSYNLLIENYKRLIENNDNFIHKVSLCTTYMERDNKLFRLYITEYTNTIHDLEILLKSIDERILELNGE